MKARVNERAWDGEWWIRYFDADGSPIGTRRGREGPHLDQLADLGGDLRLRRGRAARASAWTRSSASSIPIGGSSSPGPATTASTRRSAGVTTYPPGAKENGGIFLHANPWAVIAECMRGDGDRAWRYYQQINPAARNDDLDTFEVEPYVYPQNVLGDEHPQFGLGRNSWLSGTASWAYQAATQRILGIRPDYGALVVDPRLPGAWKGFTARRRFRGAEYRMRVRDPRGAGKGVACGVDGRQAPRGLGRRRRPAHHRPPAPSHEAEIELG